MRLRTDNWEALGFESKDEMAQVVASVDTSTPEARAVFRRWRKLAVATKGAGERLRELTAPERRIYRTDGPTVVHFSGGRTSGYLLQQILRAHGGVLPDDVKVVFTNTGMERTETLDFIRQIEDDWQVDIHWVEWRPPLEHGAPPKDARFERVTWETAFRFDERPTRSDGTTRPFDALLRSLAAYRSLHKDEEPILPGIRFRICTSHLKMKTCARYVRETFGWDHWESLIGLRWDEPDRVANIRLAPLEGGSEPMTPLADARVDEATVMSFWASHPFDLRLMQGEGNCSLCYLKSIPKLMWLMRAHPEYAEWWIEQEEMTGLTFMKKVSFRQLRERSMSLTTEKLREIEASGLFGPSIPCTCTD